MIREARYSDKFHILKFCKNTFSWGDYIDDVWDSWFSEGFLFVAVSKFPVGLCHGVFFKDHVWIEGIRISPDFRRKGIASKMVQKIESIAFDKKIESSFMLIDTKNKPSILMAKTLDYKIFQTWKFYSLSPKKNNTFKIFFGNVIGINEFPHYVKSWRWVPLDQNKLNSLQSNNQIIYSGKDENKAIVILEDSEHFPNTLIATLYSGSPENTFNVILFLQNYGTEKKYQRLQILTKETLPNFEGLEHKLSFHLMQKLLS